MGSFVSVLEQIRGPLSIVGLSFLILYGVYLRILKLRGVLQPIGPKGTFALLNTILNRLFWLALAALLLGIGSYLADVYINHQPVKITSSPSLIDARPDATLTEDVIDGLADHGKDVPEQSLENAKDRKKSLYFFSASVNRNDNASLDHFGPSLAAVDFKFKNNGQGSALLWKVGVQVIKAEINKAPDLSFRLDLKSDTGSQRDPTISTGHVLHLWASNKGWASASCKFSLQNTRLEALFGTEQMRFVSIIGSGQTTDVDLDFRTVPLEKLAELNGVLRERERRFVEVQAAIRHGDTRRLRELQEDQSFSLDDIPMENIASAIERREDVPRAEREYFTAGSFARKALPIWPIDVEGTCADENARTYHIQQPVLTYDRTCTDQFWIRADGFANTSSCSIAINMSGISDPTFAAIIDPDIGPTEKFYPLSRKIAPGDVERFYITVGTKKSARLSLRFRFFVDESTVLQSSVIDLDLWRPMDCDLPLEVADGTEFTQRADGTWELLRRRPRNTEFLSLPINLTPCQP